MRHHVRQDHPTSLAVRQDLASRTQRTQQGCVDFRCSCWTLCSNMLLLPALPEDHRHGGIERHTVDQDVAALTVPTDDGDDLVVASSRSTIPASKR